MENPQPRHPQLSRSAIFIALLAALPLMGWWAYGLFDMDEGYYASVAAEMNWRNEWITPFYNGTHWFEKPILVYWLLKPALTIFGEDFGLRLPSVLCTLGSYAMVGWFVRRHLGAPTAALAVLILASTALFVGPGRQVLLDPPFVLSLTACFLLFWESLVGDVRWRILAGGLLGVSVLGKGPVGCALFVVIAGYTFWRERELRPSFRGAWSWVAATLLFFAAVAAWYLPMLIKHGYGFFEWFIIEQNIGRFRGRDEAHRAPGLANYIYFVPVILIGMLPWSLFVPAAWPRRSKDTAPEAALRRYLATWAVVVFVFFTISGTKLPHYVMQLFPPLAILVADWTIRRWGASRRVFMGAGAWAMVIAAILIFGFPYYYRVSGQAELHALAHYVRAQKQPGEPIAEYQFARQNKKDPGTGRLKLQETTRPSLIIAVGQPVIETEEFSEVLDQPGTVWVLTRQGRISDEEFQAARAAGRALTPMDTPQKQEAYGLFRLSAAPPR